jgi:hypothetical protein
LPTPFVLGAAQEERCNVTRISSAWVKLYKYVFPAFWLGCLVFLGVPALFSSSPRAGHWQPLVILSFMIAIGVVMFRRLVWDLVDEVQDCGDYLLVRNRGEEERVALQDVMNVSESRFADPRRITLHLVRPGKFGRSIAFLPVTKLSFNPFDTSHIAKDLMVRVDRARSRRMG